MKLSALLAPLFEAKADHETIRKMVLAFEAEQNDALEQRRKTDAERQARKRSRDVTLRHSDRSLTGAEVTISSSEIEPPEKNRAPASPTPRQHLETVLDAERAAAVIEHRKRIKFPLTGHAAKLLAKDFLKWPTPNDAADEMVKRGWRGFDPSWMPGQPRAGPAAPPKPNPALDALDALSEKIDAVSPSPSEANPPYPRLVAFAGS